MLMTPELRPRWGCRPAGCSTAGWWNVISNLHPVKVQSSPNQSALVRLHFSILQARSVGWKEAFPQNERKFFQSFVEDNLRKITILIHFESIKRKCENSLQMLMSSLFLLYGCSKVRLKLGIEFDIAGLNLSHDLPWNYGLIGCWALDPSVAGGCLRVWVPWKGCVGAVSPVCALTAQCDTVYHSSESPFSVLCQVPAPVSHWLSQTWVRGQGQKRSNVTTQHWVSHHTWGAFQALMWHWWCERLIVTSHQVSPSDISQC